MNKYCAQTFSSFDYRTIISSVLAAYLTWYCLLSCLSQSTRKIGITKSCMLSSTLVSHTLSFVVSNTFFELQLVLFCKFSLSSQLWKQNDNYSFCQGREEEEWFVVPLSASHGAPVMGVCVRPISCNMVVFTWNVPVERQGCDNS